MIAFLASLLIARNPALALPYARRLVKFGLAVAAVLAAVIAFTVWLGNREQAAVERDRIAANAEAATQARKADERAHSAADGTKQDVERTNAEARKAAAGSDDSLRAGLERLRAETRPAR